MSENVDVKLISIYNIEGRLIDDISYRLQPINISSLESGIYILKIETNTGDKTNKRVIKR